MMTISKLWNLLLEQIWLLARFSFTRLHVGRPLKGGLEALHFTLHLGGGPGAQTPRGLLIPRTQIKLFHDCLLSVVKFLSNQMNCSVNLKK